MIDLHCHMLPAVDDGAKTLTMSIQMAKSAESEGIDKILLTPHHMDGEFVNHKSDVVNYVDNLQKTLNDNGLNIELRAGQEVHLNGELLNEIDRDDILYADADTKRYIMLELPTSGVPEYMGDMIFELHVKGIVPVIVHPERNHGIQSNPDTLYELVRQGCLTQITATSYVGGFGKKIQRFTDQIVESGLGFMFSSDAHNLSGRRFEMDEAFKRLSKIEGSKVAKQYMENANRIWNGETVVPTDFRKISSPTTIKKIVGKIFRHK